MSKRLIAFVVVVFFIASGSIVLAQQYSANAMKKIEELKIMSRDKKDMPESMPGVKKITAEELKKWLETNKKFVFLDNRVPADFEKERIAKAVRLSPDDLLEKGPKAAEQLGLKKDDTIVFY
ncbi:MAG: hypothetical protein HQL10_04480 [Nitrospirae bacterium]|nr:hypothetical protein [Nitrospirota bacterium]